MRNRDLRKMRKQKQERVHSSERSYIDVSDLQLLVPSAPPEVANELVYGPYWREFFAERKRNESF